VWHFRDIHISQFDVLCELPRGVLKFGTGAPASLPRQKRYAHRPALDRPAVLCKENLEFLWPLMCSTVKLCGGERARV